MTPIPAATADASAWAVAAVRSFDGTVGSLLPPVFPAYARVFHPALLEKKPVPWREVAAAHHRMLHPLAQWRQINPPLPGEPSDQWGRDLSSISPRLGVWDEEPLMGSLPTVVAARLASVLAAHTTTPDSCSLAIWNGYGGLDPRWTRAPRFGLPGRDLLLLSGPIAAAAFSLSEPPSSYRQLHPNLWWPSDHAWCVATDVDMMTTYVGGRPEVIEAVLADSGLEALPATADDLVTWESDTVNRRSPFPANREGAPSSTEDC